MIDRPTIQRTFFRGLSDLAVGPWYNESIFADPSVRPIAYNRAESIALLTEAGWMRSPEERFFYRWSNGKKEYLHFTILLSNRVALRHLTFIQEDAARAGVDIELKLVDRTTFTQSLDARSFDMVDYGWGSPVEFDPGPAWACAQAKEGLNVSGFCDPRVDELAGKAASTFSIEARIPFLREMYRRVAAAVPQIFLLNENSTYYAVSRRVGRSRNFFKYDAGVPYMWLEKGREER
jgi:ABC-type transport system substrate-binding protein